METCSPTGGCEDVSSLIPSCSWNVEVFPSFKLHICSTDSKVPYPNSPQFSKEPFSVYLFSWLRKTDTSGFIDWHVRPSFPLQISTGRHEPLVHIVICVLRLSLGKIYFYLNIYGKETFLAKKGDFICGVKRTCKSMIFVLFYMTPSRLWNKWFFGYLGAVEDKVIQGTSWIISVLFPL